MPKTVIPERATPVLYLDLDDTVRHGLNTLGRFVNGPKDVVVFPEVPPMLARYKQLGWRIVACSNQGGIALGYVSMGDVAASMLLTQRLVGDAFDKVVWCRHHPSAPDPEFAVCWCRKPRAGMVIDAAMTMAEESRMGALKPLPGFAAGPEFYPPHMALFVGDRPEDEGCADAANVRFMDAVVWRTGEHLRELEP